jgi:hypothetical protein
MKYLKLLYSPKMIYSERDVPLYKSLFAFIFSTLLLVLGILLYFLRLDTINPNFLSSGLLNHIPQTFPEDLPNCQVSNTYELICHDETNYTLMLGDVEVLINPSINEADFQNQGVHFGYETITIYNGSSKTYTLDYQDFKDVDLNEYKTQEGETVIRDVSNRLFLSIKPYFASSFLIFTYFLVLVLNALLIFGMSSLGMVLNKRKLKLKQMWTVATFASITPSIIAFILFNFSPLLPLIIYNFSLSAFFIFIYFKEIHVKGKSFKRK